MKFVIRTHFRAMALAASLIPFSANGAVETQMPDFYAEPGLHPFRGQVTANINETIDTFSGSLNILHTDLVIPGEGGLDIKIQRSYNSNSVYDPTPSEVASLPYPTYLNERTPYGSGWTLHFGRLVGFGTPIICSDSTYDNLDNPIFELPDGRQQILFRNASGSSYYITKDQWIASCASNGMVLISPEGTKYTVNQPLYSSRSGGLEYMWYTTRIEDRNGNWINIEYDTVADGGKEPVFRRITSSDGRLVSFAYSNTSDFYNIRLSSITANNQTWTYSYTAIDEPLKGLYHLSRVNGPSGFSWSYAYYPKRAYTESGNRLLSHVTYPYGGVVEYTYRFECLNAPANVSCSNNGTFYSFVVGTKRNWENGNQKGSWSYSYSPSTTEDVTTVNFPGGRYIFRHYGSKAYLGGSSTPGQSIWRVGLLKEKETYSGATRIKRELYTWEPLNRISYERYVRPPYLQYSDYATFAPVLTRKEVILDGTSYVTVFDNFDASFNPQTITETGQATRITNVTYFPRTAGQNIVSLVQDEVIQGEATGKNIYRTFDGRGNLQQITKRGVTENFTYYASGDVETRRNTRDGISRVWTYLGYFRGIPQIELHPESVRIDRIVNPTGTIASETSGRRYTTAYTYDGMNRLRGIQRPAGTPITVTWNVSGLTTTGRTVSRGTTYTQTTAFDPFGRTASINTNGITKTFRYNDIGHISFESYLSAALGDTYGTDVLGRVVSVAHGDGTSRSQAYQAGNRMLITNERGYSTLYTYRSFGDPENGDERVLMRIDAPEGVSTIFARDVLGLPSSIAQGGVTRTYGYDARNFLTSETNPETGLTVYGRDERGNMRSRAVGGSAVTVFGHDNLDRLVSIDYPGGTPDVTYGYDGNNNVTGIANGVTTRSYDYDTNDNLTNESLTVNGRTFSATHGYNTLDYLASTTYPSGQMLAYNPDGLGRATTVSPYITTPVLYHPIGSPSDFTYFNGRRTTVAFNTRHWIDRIAAFNSQSYAVDLRYGYDGIGNVTVITDGLNSSFSRGLGYDGLDRLMTANGVWGAGSIGYNTAGNITSQTLGSFNLSYSYSSNRLGTVSGSKPYSFGYDTYGNVTSNGYHNFAYNDASNLTTVTTTSGSLVGTYTYDGNNMRARVQQGGKDTYLFYAKDGKLLGEYDADGRYKEYAYLGSRLVAMRGVSPSNQAPVANAGSDESIGEGLPVTLNGGASSDPDGTIARYSWRQTAGPTVSLSGASTATPSFSTPRVRANTTLTFALYVNDGDFGTSSDSVNVVVQNTSDDDDSDGLSDLWESAYFGHLNYGPNDDPDNDGLTNLQENIEGTNPNATAPTPGRVTVVQANGGISSNIISWQPVTSAASYNVYWSTNPGVTKANGNRISGVRTPYGHPGLTNGTRYYYVVTAQNNSGESAESPEVSAVPSIAPLIPILELLLSD